jgi:hypothetical protein
MPSYPTALSASTRHANFDNLKIYFLPAVAATTFIPTRAEMTAGTDLTGEISDISGFTVTGNDIDAPDLESEFVSKVPGRTTAEDSSLTFYADEGTDDVRSLLPYKTAGFLAFLDGGDIAAQTMDVFPVRVRSVGKTRSVGDELARVVVGFSITAEPALDVTIPANP